MARNNNSSGNGFRNRHATEKPKNLVGTWVKILSYCKPYRYAIIFAVILSMSAAFITLAGPSQIKNITNIIVAGFENGIDMEAVKRIGVFLVSIYLIGFLLNYIQEFIIATAAVNTAKRIRTDLSTKINRLPLNYFDTTSTGNILSRVTNDVDRIGETLQTTLSSVVASITVFIGSVILMLVTNYILALTAIISACIGFSLMAVIMRKSQKYFSLQQSTLGLLNGHIEEVYSGHNIIKVYNGTHHARNQFDVLNNNLYTTAWKSQFLSGLMNPLMVFAGNFSYVMVCIVGALLTLKGYTSLGVLVAFMIYVRLFTNPLGRLSQAGTSIQMAAAAGERIFEFLEEKELEPENENILKLENAKGNIEFKNVKFGYQKDKTIIKNFSASVKQGQKVAIIGPTGAGKTTLVNLLMRFYEIDEGDIIIDGISIKNLTRENVHDLFCMVLQDTWIFEGTVKENIVYSKENVSDEEIIRVAKTVGIHHFIQTLPNGYDTVINDKVNISNGQKQLITIARAMIENAPMLILDEATSSVDTRTEILIQQAMDALTVGRTSFVIAHRLSTIKNADLILVIKNGDIVESGVHEELLAKNGFYAEIYNSQFDTENI